MKEGNVTNFLLVSLTTIAPLTQEEMIFSLWFLLGRDFNAIELAFQRVGPMGQALLLSRPVTFLLVGTLLPAH
jgi:hypothetical protein